MRKKLSLLLLMSFVAVQAFSSDNIKKNNLKTTVLSYITGSAKITYERALFEGQSVEITAGRIGVGGDAKKNNPEGVTTRLAYKWIFPSSFSNNNPLNGFYLKPEIAYSIFDYNHSVDGAILRDEISRAAIMGCVGWQWVKEWFVFDFYIGAGGAVGKNCPDNYYHGFVGLNPDSDVALTFGLKLGVAL